MSQIRVGVGVIIRRASDSGDVILVGCRKGSHGEGTWCPPGGHLDYGETTEACARREVLEETGLELLTVSHPFASTNAINSEGTQYITLLVNATVADDAVPKLMEPNKCEGWEWHQLFKVPKPHFTPFEIMLANIVESGVYNHAIVSNKKAPGDLKIDDYVFASRWNDCCPGDPWHVGYVSEVHEDYVILVGSKRSWPNAMRITEAQGWNIVASFPAMEDGPSLPYLQIAEAFGHINPKEIK